MKIQDTLQAAIDDPMWADHAEISKASLQAAVDLIKSLERDARRFHMLIRMTDDIGVTDFDNGPVCKAAEAMSQQISEEFGEQYVVDHSGEMMVVLLDRMIEKFGSEA